MDQIVDWFGTDVKMSFIRESEDKVKVVLSASPLAMEHWAMQYANHVEVISPKYLRKRVKECLTEALKKY